jgi:hypothetical protein
MFAAATLDLTRPASKPDGRHCAEAKEATMKVSFTPVIMAGALMVAGLLSGCISSSSPSPPEKTTVVVPANGTTVVCQDGTKPPCN